MRYKTCRKCKIKKNSCEFGKASRNKDGLRSHCKQCDNEANKLWYAKNTERNKQRSVKWIKANKEKFREYRERWEEENKERRRKYLSEWYQKNKESLSIRQKEWWNANPDKRKLYKHRYYGKMKEQLGEVSSDIVERLFIEQRGLCYYCGIDLEEWHLEHMIPISRGGLHDDRNLCISCPTCNLRKQNKTAEEFIQQAKEEKSWQ